MQEAIRISLAITVITVIVSPVAGWLFMKTGVYRPMVGAFLLSAAGTTVFAFFHYSITELLLAGCLWAVSIGALYAATPNLIIEGVPQHQQGASAGLFGAASAFGTALGGTIFTAAAIAHRSVSSSRHRAGSPPSLRSRRSTLTLATRRRS